MVLYIYWLSNYLLARFLGLLLIDITEDGGWVNWSAYDKQGSKEARKQRGNEATRRKKAKRRSNEATKRPSVEATTLTMKQTIHQITSNRQRSVKVAFVCF